MAKPNSASVDSSKLSVVQLAARVQIQQLIATLGFVLGIGFAGGKFHSDYQDAKEDLRIRTQLSDIENQRATAASTAASLGNRLFACEEAAYASAPSGKGPAQPTPLDSVDSGAVSPAALARDIASLRARVTDTTQKLKACESRPEIPLDAYFIHTTTGTFDQAKCFSASLAAGERLGLVVTRKDHEVALTGNFSGEPQICNVGCRTDAVIVSCNGRSNNSNIGLANRIAEFVSR